MRINYPATWPAVAGADHANELASRFNANREGINLSAQFRGTYSSATAYDVNDLVTYNGVRYLAVLAGTGQTPDASPTYWERLTRLITTDDVATGGQFSKEQLEYIAATDLANNLALAANTWVEVVPNQSFTIERADNRQVNTFPSGCILITTADAAGGRWAAQLTFDSATTARTLPVGGGWIGQNQYANILQGTGSPRITGLGSGAHTVKLEVRCEKAAAIYCRAATLPIYENFKLRIVEGKR